jgi:hypothetical protein
MTDNLDRAQTNAEAGNAATAAAFALIDIARTLRRIETHYNEHDAR